jgi:hypothetical protein
MRGVSASATGGLSGWPVRRSGPPSGTIGFEAPVSLNFSALAFLAGVWLERRRRLGPTGRCGTAADTEDQS